MSNDLTELHAENVARVNARLAAVGRCVMHNTGDDRSAAVIICLPNGNELPICGDCWEWWQSTIRDVVTADPLSIPVWVRDLAGRSA